MSRVSQPPLRPPPRLSHHAISEYLHPITHITMPLMMVSLAEQPPEGMGLRYKGDCQGPTLAHRG